MKRVRVVAEGAGARCRDRARRPASDQPAGQNRESAIIAGRKRSGAEGTSIRQPAGHPGQFVREVGPAGAVTLGRSARRTAPLHRAPTARDGGPVGRKARCWSSPGAFLRTPSQRVRLARVWWLRALI